MVSARKKLVGNMYKKITSQARPEYGHQKAFICEADLGQIWSKKEIKKVLDYSRGGDFDLVKNKLLKTLSILILIDVPDLTKALESLCLQPSLRLTDRQLPFSKQDLDCLGTQKSDQFYEKQFLFCPIVIENRPEAGVIYSDKRCPFPFMEDRSARVGSGGYGSVHRNKIAPQYLRDTKANLANPEACHFVPWSSPLQIDD